MASCSVLSDAAGFVARLHEDSSRPVEPMAHMFLLVGKDQVVEWWSRDIGLPVRFEKNIRLRPRGTKRTQ